MSNIVLAAGSDEGYQISRSVRLRSSASAYFNRTFGSSSYGHSFSFWVKRGALGAARTVFGYSNGSTESFGIEFNSSDQLDFFSYSSGYIARRLTTQVFRDPSAWYHIVCVVDSANATASQRMRVYVNGTESTAFSASVNQAQNQYLNLTQSTWSWGIGRMSGAALQYFDGYLTEFNYVEQALTPSSFGETDSITGVWKPKKYAGTYGTNGFYLNFSDNSSNTATTIGKDYSGNGNNWTPNNISVTAGVTYDSMIDVPTLYADGGNGRGNYAVLNPLKNFGTTLSAANLQGAFTPATAAAWQVHGSMAMTSGKWYWEVFLVSAPTTNGIGIGVALDTANVTTQNFTSGAGWLYYTQNGNKYNTGAAAYGSSSTTNDVIGVALDMDAGTLTFYKNNVSQGQAFSGLSGNSLVALIGYDQSGTSSFAINFGQRPFAYTPPTGFKALNTQNLPEPTIKKGNQYFDATTYTGNGSTQSIVNAGGFQPDLVWAKSRGIGNVHQLFDSVRGVFKALYSNLTNAETNDTATLSSFNSNGFSLASSSGINTNADPLVAWQWKESPSAGFDIVTYTGTGSATTVAHSLGVAPKLMFIKARSLAGSGWTTYSSVLGAGQFLSLNATDAATSSIFPFNNTAPTSSVFSVGPTGNGTNNSGVTYVAYLFAEVAGYSKFGSYTGNGSADGPFVFCGFRPRYILWKEASGANAASVSWQVLDTARNPSNVSNTMLYPNLSGAEGAGDNVDILSNGFKIRSSGYFVNESGGTYIFAAFAENPFKNSLAR